MDAFTWVTLGICAGLLIMKFSHEIAWGWRYVRAHIFLRCKYMSLKFKPCSTAEDCIAAYWKLCKILTGDDADLVFKQLYCSRSNAHFLDCFVAYSKVPYKELDNYLQVALVTWPWAALFFVDDPDYPRPTKKQLEEALKQEPYFPNDSPIRKYSQLFLKE